MPRVDVAGREITKSKFFRMTEKTRKVEDLGSDIPLVVQLGRGTKTYRVTRVSSAVGPTELKGPAPRREPTFDLKNGPKGVRRSNIFESRRCWVDILDPFYTNITIYLVLELRARGHGLDQLNALILQTSEVANSEEPWLIEWVKQAVKFLWPRSKGRIEDQLRLDLWYYGPNGKLR